MIIYVQVTGVGNQQLHNNLNSRAKKNGSMILTCPILSQKGSLVPRPQGSGDMQYKPLPVMYTV